MPRAVPAAITRALFLGRPKADGIQRRLTTGSNGRDVLEPIDFKGNVLLADHGNLDAASHVETLRTHPVLGFLFNQRGGLDPAAVIAEFDGNGQATNLPAMSASELYLASYARKPVGRRGLGGSRAPGVLPPWRFAG